jgi:hypothetical protein
MNGKNHPFNNPLMVVGSSVGSDSLNFFPHNQRIIGFDSFKRRTRGFTKELVKNALVLRFFFFFLKISVSCCALQAWVTTSLN